MPVTQEELKQILVQSSLATENQISDAVSLATETDTNLQEVLVQQQVVTDQQLGEAVAAYLQVPFINLQGININPSVLDLIPLKVAREQLAVAFEASDQSIKLAMNDVKNPYLPELVSIKTGGKPIQVYYATARDIRRVFPYYQKNFQREFDKLLEKGMVTTADGIDDPPIEKIVDLLIDSAYESKASDVHIEPHDEVSLVRYRVDGVLHDTFRIPKVLHPRIVTRIKVLSRLRTDEHFSAQDGKMFKEMSLERLDLRISIIPIVEGEKIVMRLLASKTNTLTLDTLGFSEDDLAKVRRGIERPNGMVLATGPTGSGKTTTIYSMLKLLNTRDVNITSIEDPVEYKIEGANQVQVNTKTNLTFAQGLRSLLRQDPNIIFVGEIRDNETAGIAVNAALTGHLVLSTLHTNDAATTIPRMMDMEVEPFLVASTVNVVIAQRLVRKIHQTCRIPEKVDFETLSTYFPKESVQDHLKQGKSKELLAFRGQGCPACNNTGYSGRIGVYEVLEVTDTLRPLIVAKKDADEIRAAAQKEGMTLMYEDGLKKVAQGLTTIEEILRVTTSDT